MNVFPRNTNLSCYRTADKAISKDIEPGIINYVPLYQIQLIIPKHQKKVEASHKVKNRLESA